MCYLVAKDINKRGCVALKTKHGPELVALKKELILLYSCAYLLCALHIASIMSPVL